MMVLCLKYTATMALAMKYAIVVVAYPADSEHLTKQV
jgi:hypothetical protein